jgi:hypothetical protein
MGEVRLLVLKSILRDDNTGPIYTGGVNDDMIQNAIPIATNTILIIFYLHLVCYGEYPGMVPGLHTHILHGNR